MMRSDLGLASLLVPAAILLAAPLSKPAAPPLRVQCDPRVELLSLVFRLAGNPEYNNARLPAFEKEVDAYFSIFRSHPAVDLAARLRRRQGISYDAVMSMAVHITDTVKVSERVPFDPLPDDLDSRWTTASAREFLTQLRAFVKDSDFNGFYKKQQSLYDLTAARFTELVQKESHLEWFNEFFGPRHGADFVAIPALLNGGQCYGARCRLPDKSEQLFCILGVWQSDTEGKPTFDKSVLPTVIHEFTHSYTNPLVEAHAARLQKAGQRIFPLVADQMKGQAYGDWLTMMRETMVRACVIRYVGKYHGPGAVKQAIREEEDRGFAWMKELVDLLGGYEADRSKAATLDEFMPQIVAFFDEYAPRFEKERRLARSKAPHVVSMTPANRGRNVDPNLTELRVVFDRPMRTGGYAVVGGGPHFPEVIGKASYDATGRIFSLPIRLKPNWSYELWLNRGKFNSFASRDGFRLEPVHVTFSTAAAKP